MEPKVYKERHTFAVSMQFNWQWPKGCPIFHWTQSMCPISLVIYLALSFLQLITFLLGTSLLRRDCNITWWCKKVCKEKRPERDGSRMAASPDHQINISLSTSTNMQSDLYAQPRRQNLLHYAYFMCTFFIQFIQLLPLRGDVTLPFALFYHHRWSRRPGALQVASKWMRPW